MQHYFQEDTLPSRANFYVAVKVHSDDAGEQESEDYGYEPVDEDSDEEGAAAKKGKELSEDVRKHPTSVV